MATFTGNRYMTAGIQNEIPLEIQIIMWNMIDENAKKRLKMDYLQVFELSSFYLDGVRMQEITHRQEQPSRKNTFAYETDNPISAKIFVIDSDSYVTMLFNYEY